MAKPSKDVSLAAFAESHGKSEEWARLLVAKQGMPHRKNTQGQYRVVPSIANTWLLKREAHEATQKERERHQQEEGLDKEQELAGKYRVDRLRSEWDFQVEQGKYTPTAETQAIIDELVGGFAAVASGRLRSFERDIVQAQTPADARRITQRIHAALMDGGREYRKQIEAEAARLEAESAPEENAA